MPEASRKRGAIRRLRASCSETRPSIHSGLNAVNSCSVCLGFSSIQALLLAPRCRVKGCWHGEDSERDAARRVARRLVCSCAEPNSRNVWAEFLNASPLGSVRGTSDSGNALTLMGCNTVGEAGCRTRHRCVPISAQTSDRLLKGVGCLFVGSFGWLISWFSQR